MRAPIYVLAALAAAGIAYYLAATPESPTTAAAVSPASADASQTASAVLTEAGTRRRASLHVLQGERDLAALDPGGAEPLDLDLAAFERLLTRENHTLKRALTDPRTFAGIGNAYSDEILHRAKLSPLALTSKLAPDEVARLYTATREVLAECCA